MLADERGTWQFSGTQKRTDNPGDTLFPVVSRQLQQLSPTVAVRLSPADARALGVESGETLRLATEERETLLRARLDRAVRRGTVVVPWHSGRGGSAAALVTGIGAPQAVQVRRSR